MTQMTDAIGTTSYGYSNGGLLLTCTQGAVGRALTCAYDAEGHRITRNVAGVSNPDPIGAWQTNYNYDCAGRLAAILDARVSTLNPFQYAWTPGANLVDHVTMPNGVVQQKAYDQGGRLTGISLSGTMNNQFSTVNSLSYGYNALSLRTSEQNAITNGTRSFSYDAQRQLKEVDAALNSQPSTLNFSFTYDPIGNWQSQTVPSATLPGTLVTGTFAANNLNQYIAILQPGGATTYAPVHDYNGNLTDNGHGTTYEWDDENRLKASNTPQNRVEFSYNGHGWRVEKRVYDASGATPQKTTRFVYDGVNLVEEIDVTPGSGTGLVRSYTIGLDLSQTFDGAGGVGGLLAATDYSSQFAGSYYYGYDGNGNVTDLVDGNGVDVAHYEYNPFGILVSKTGGYANENPFRWSTKYHDDETKLTYYGYRYYSPEMGRWISRDPIREDGTNYAEVSGGLNLYEFIGNNPNSQIDPLGLALYAIDGTDEDSSKQKNASQLSNTYRLYRATQESISFYWPGPIAQKGLTGSDSIAIALTVFNKIQEDFCAAKQRENPCSKHNGNDFTINLTGWSRGAMIAARVAQMISDGGFWCNNDCGYNLKNYQANIQWIGLFDAVSMIMTNEGGWPKAVPQNVLHLDHAVKTKNPSSLPYPTWHFTGSKNNERPFYNHNGTLTSHGDIGISGNNNDAYIWMKSQAIAAGVKF